MTSPLPTTPTERSSRSGMKPSFEARTAYDVPILSKTLRSRADAAAWSKWLGDTFPGCRVVQKTRTGVRTIWRHVPEEIAA